MAKNDRYDKLFDTDAKAEAFDKIAARFYDGNFGQMSKSDFETLLFHLYIEECLKKSLPFDDYTLSRALGITQSRIRTLKVKKELQYPHEGFEWKKAFIGYIKHAKYDEATRLVKMTVPDVNVLIELRYHMETHGWYDEYQLNPKLFQCRLDIFLELCSSFEDEQELQLDSNAEKALKELQKKVESQKEKTALQKIIDGSVKEGVKEIAAAASKELVFSVLGLVPCGGLVKAGIQALKAVIEKSL